MLVGAVAPSFIGAMPQVAESTYRADADAGGLDLRAQARNVDFDGVGRELAIDVEEAFGDLLLAEDAARSRYEQLEECPLAWRQIDSLVMDAHALGGLVDGKSGNRQRRSVGQVAPQERPY